jgi:hypothetical protein
VAGNLGRHYYKNPLTALIFAGKNLRLGNLHVIGAGFGEISVELAACFAQTGR